MHAILLCAGLGSRLLPLTADRPKCLIEVAGRAILDHQVSALREAGVEGITIVGGYRLTRLQAYVEDRWSGAARPEILFNPYYAISGSIGSVWAARESLAGPFCILNGDTVYDPALVADGLSRTGSGLSLFVEKVSRPTTDDMLVHMHGDQVTAVGKGLSRHHATHRSLGFVVCADARGGDYVDALTRTIVEADGPQAFHHAVVDRLARAGAVRGIPFTDGVWTEIDRPDDIALWAGPWSEPESVASRRAANL